MPRTDREESIPSPSVRTLPHSRTINSWFQLGPFTACTPIAYSIVTDRGQCDRRGENLRRAVIENMPPAGLYGWLRPTPFGR
jgi:hypothetical protein